MASARAMIERRRSSRVATRIPVKIFRSELAASQTLDHSAEAIGVSRCGAPACPSAVFTRSGSPSLGSRIAVQNNFSSEARERSASYASALAGQESGLL